MPCRTEALLSVQDPKIRPMSVPFSTMRKSAARAPPAPVAVSSLTSCAGSLVAPGSTTRDTAVRWPQLLLISADMAHAYNANFPATTSRLSLSRLNAWVRSSKPMPTSTARKRRAFHAALRKRRQRLASSMRTAPTSVAARPSAAPSRGGPRCAERRCRFAAVGRDRKIRESAGGTRRRLHDCRAARGLFGISAGDNRRGCVAGNIFVHLPRDILIRASLQAVSSVG